MLSMLPPADEIRMLESRMQELEGFQDRIRPAPSDDGVSDIVSTTSDGSYPTVASAVYACVTQQIDAQDTEGATATYSPDGGKLYAVNLGTGVPPISTMLVVHSLGGRWVFRWDS